MKPPRMALDEIVSRIVEEKGLSRKQVFDLIEKKKNLLSHMISDEGAADIVAKELGVRTFPESEDEELTLTVVDLVTGMSNITISGRITKINPIREFTDRMGNKSFVCNAVIADKSGNMRVVLWGDMANLVRDDKIKVGTIIRINGGYVKEDLAGRAELHVGKKGKIEIEPKGITQLGFPENSGKLKRVAELKTDMVETDFVGMIKEISPPRVTKTKDGREVTVSSLIVEDASKATVRIVFWNDKVSSMENTKKGDTIEVSSGRIRLNKYGEIEIHVGSGSTTNVIPSNSESALTEIPLARKISQLELGVQNVPIEGIVAGVPTFRLFSRNNGTNGKILSFTLSDGTSTVRAVAWGETAEELRTIKNGDRIRIEESTLKLGIRGNQEIHIKDFEILKPSRENEDENVKAQQDVNEPGHKQANLALRKDVCQLANGETAEIRGMITRVQNKSPVYRACPKCLRKVEAIEGKWLCSEDGAIGDPEVRILYSLTLDDGTGGITCVLSGSLGEELIGIKDDELLVTASSGLEHSNAILSGLLGLEIIFMGKCVFNPKQKRNELRVTRFIRPDPRAEARILLEHIRNDLGA